MKILNENVRSVLASETVENSTVRRVFAVIVVSVALLLFASHLRASEHRRVINVSTLSQLYAAVNDAGNAGATIHLAPGTYVLSATNAEGKPRRHHGTLRLQPGMALVGSERRVDSNFDGVPDPVSSATPDDFAVPGTETKIDGSELILQPSDFIGEDCAGEVFDIGVAGAMIVINRKNLISSLHLFGAGNIAIGEPGPEVGSVNVSARIRSTVLEGFPFAMTFGNSGCNARGSRSVLIFTNNVVRNPDGFGLVLLNFLTGNAANDTSNGPEIKATISSNLFYNNFLAGLSARGGVYGTDGGLTTLEMTRNVFRNNGANFLGIGGAGRVTHGPPIANQLHVTSRFDTFGETFGSPGVFLVASRFFDHQGEPQHGQIKAEFFHSNFVRDTPASTDTPEISIIGGENGGSDNHITVLIRRATVKTSGGSPTFGKLLIHNETGSGTAPNTARLRGSREAFLQSNQGFHAPAAKFFLKK